MQKSVFRCAAFCCVSLFLFVATAFSQTVTGSISGEVSDPSGALVANAKVTAENIETSVKTTTVTNGAGVYTIRFLPVGRYTVTLEAPGFAEETSQPFPLEIDQTVKFNVQLKVNAISGSVEVHDEIHPILNTTDSSLGETLSSNEIQNIPLNGRNFSSLTLFVPGAIDTDPQGLTGNNAIERETYNNGQVQINGNRAQENNYMIEGADNNEPQNNLIGYNPAPEAIEQVKVVSANAPASYGNANGGAIITVLKSGTNSFHGTVYDYFRNNNLDANTWSNNHAYPVIPIQHYTQQIFGGAFGGPILHNRLFFFVDYEGVRKHTGGFAQASVLTPAMLGGDFSSVLQVLGTQLYDTQNNFAPYADNQVPVVNPVAQFLLANPKLYPAPNATPTDGVLENNYQGPQSSYVTNNQEDFKVDFTPGNVNKFNGFYSQGKGSDYQTAIIPVFFPSHNVYPSKLGGGSWVHTFSPAIINEARIGFTRVYWDNSVPTDPSGQFGLTGDQKVGIPFGTQAYVGFSGQSFSGNSFGSGNGSYNSPSYIGTNANLQYFIDNTFNYEDNLTWQHGRHLFSIGVQATRYQQNFLNDGNVGFLGTFGYSGAFTSNPNVSSGAGGYSAADFVLDRVANKSVANPTSFVGQRQWRSAGYFQDDFKLSSRLTLNLGLRYEYDQPWYEQNNKTANVLPGGIVEYAGSIPSLAAPGSIVCPTRACYDANYKQFMPRFGWAFQAAPRYVIRGGYGATSFFEGYSFNQRLVSSPPFSEAISQNAPTPVGTSGGAPFAVTDGFGTSYGINNTLYSVWPQKVQPAYVSQWNLTNEFALTHQLSLSAGYHGQSGAHLADYRNLNQLTLAQAQQIYNLGLAQTYCNSGVTLPANLLAPYYNLEGECNPILLTESAATMNYNALQVTARQRAWHGLEYTLNYTWAKSMTNSSGDYGVPNQVGSNGSFQDGYNPAADYGPSGFDIRHSMNFVGVYQIPFGRGQEFGSSMNRALDAAIGGWRLGTSAILYSGLPITINGPGNSLTNSWGQSRANRYGNFHIVDRTINNWWGIDPSAQPCSGVPAPGQPCAYGAAVLASGLPTFGTAGVNSERAPGFRQVDLSLFKDFHIPWHESVVNFRADIFNSFNIASYGNPDSGITDGTFGQINSTRSAPREIQLSLHYSF